MLRIRLIILLISIFSIILIGCSSSIRYMPEKKIEYLNEIQITKNKSIFIQVNGSSQEEKLENFEFINDSIIYKKGKQNHYVLFENIDYIKYKDLKTGLINGALYGTILGSAVMSLAFIDEINAEVYYNTTNSGLPSNYALYNSLGAIGGGIVGLITGGILKNNQYLYEESEKSIKEHDHFLTLGYSLQPKGFMGGICFNVGKNYNYFDIKHRITLHDFSKYQNSYDIGFVKYAQLYSVGMFYYELGISYGITVFESSTLYNDIYGSGYGFRIEPTFGYRIYDYTNLSINLNISAVLPIYKSKQVYIEYTNNIFNPEHFNVIEKKDIWAPAFKINIGLEF